MKFEDAVKSGKPFRHPSMNYGEYYFVTPYGYIGGASEGGFISVTITIKAEHILNDQWEVKE